MVIYVSWMVVPRIWSEEMILYISEWFCVLIVFGDCYAEFFCLHAGTTWKQKRQTHAPTGFISRVWYSFPQLEGDLHLKSLEP
jgi:hypothetical protein